MVQWFMVPDSQSLSKRLPCGWMNGGFIIKMIGTERCVSGARTQLAHSGRAEPISIVQDSMFGIRRIFIVTYAIW